MGNSKQDFLSDANNGRTETALRTYLFSPICPGHDGKSVCFSFLHFFIYDDFKGVVYSFQWQSVPTCRPPIIIVGSVEKESSAIYLPTVRIKGKQTRSLPSIGHVYWLDLPAGIFPTPFITTEGVRDNYVYSERMKKGGCQSEAQWYEGWRENFQKNHLHDQNSEAI